MGAFQPTRRPGSMRKPFETYSFWRMQDTSNIPACKMFYAQIIVSVFEILSLLFTFWVFGVESPPAEGGHNDVFFVDWWSCLIPHGCHWSRRRC